MAAAAPNGVFLTNPLVYDASAAATATQAAAALATPLGELLPDNVRAWLARTRLLEGVPFQHIVPDSQLLPPESIRFFYLDREWTDALVQGALSVGTITTLDRQQLEGMHAAIRDEVDAEERRIRLVGNDSVGLAAAGTIGGFLLRSRAVSGWPALHVRAYSEEIGPDDAQLPVDHPKRIRLLRLERLAPAVLLCLFDGVPAIVHIEEPRQGVQYGVDLPTGGATAPITIRMRDVTLGLPLGPGRPLPWFANVKFRKGGAAGVINVDHFATLIANAPSVKASQVEGPGLSSGEMAMELLQFPFRQVFGQTPSQLQAEPDGFHPVLGEEAPA